jgi:hypothetical protein
LSPQEKEAKERELREEGRELRRGKKPREASRKFDRAKEISREKSRAAQHH